SLALMSLLEGAFPRLDNGWVLFAGLAATLFMLHRRTPSGPGWGLYLSIALAALALISLFTGRLVETLIAVALLASGPALAWRGRAGRGAGAAAVVTAVPGPGPAAGRGPAGAGARRPGARLGRRRARGGRGQSTSVGTAKTGTALERISASTRLPSRRPIAPRCCLSPMTIRSAPTSPAAAGSSFAGSP